MLLSWVAIEVGNVSTGAATLRSRTRLLQPGKWPHPAVLEKR